MPGLFDPITIQGLTLKNRIVMPPMANHSALLADPLWAQKAAEKLGVRIA